MGTLASTSTILHKDISKLCVFDITEGPDFIEMASKNMGEEILVQQVPNHPGDTLAEAVNHVWFHCATAKFICSK